MGPKKNTVDDAQSHTEKPNDSITSVLYEWQTTAEIPMEDTIYVQQKRSLKQDTLSYILLTNWTCMIALQSSKNNVAKLTYSSW